MRCAFCHREMAYIHGHAACVTSGCPMYGVNQAPCCDGETAAAAPLPTAAIAAIPRPLAPAGAAVSTPRRAPARRRP